MCAEIRERHKNMGPANINFFWAGDKVTPYPMTLRIKLDHEINGEELRAAFDETLSVWPLLRDSFLEAEDGNIYFTENPNPIQIHHTQSIVPAGKGPNDDRVIALSYYGDTLTFTGLHAFLDGGSLFMVMRGTICRYLRSHYGKDYNVGELPAPGDGDRPENYEYYIGREDIIALPYEKKEAIWCTPDCFEDPKTKNQKGTPLSMSRVEMKENDFIAYCKKIGSNPTVMFTILMAQTVYRIYPEETRPFTGMITMNVRDNLGIPMAIMGQSSAMMLEITREELEHLSLEELVKQKRAVMSAQRSKDYLLSRADDMRNGRAFLRDNYSLRLSYFGDFNYGECTPHIKDILSYNESYDELHMFALNGTLYIDMQCASVSEQYASALSRILNDAGLAAKVSGNYTKLQGVER